MRSLASRRSLFSVGSRSVHLPKKVVHVKLDNGLKFALSPLQLRERCGPRQASTGQRLFELSDHVDASEIVSLKQDTLGFDVVFKDGQTARFLAKEFDEEVWREKELVLPKRTPWTPSTTIGDLTVNDPTNTGQISTILLTYGACLVRNVTPTVEQVPKFVNQFGTIRHTEWGKTFHVQTASKQTNPNADSTLTEDVAYTDEAIDLHVDQPYRRPQPGYWGLHCLQDASGGHSLISDGFAVAQELQRTNPRAFDALCSVPLRFEYFADGTTDLIADQPHFGVDDLGRLHRVSFSGRVDAVSLGLSADKAREYYAARHHFITLARSMALGMHLQVGDLIVLDNTRTMHGRTEITYTNPAQAKRHLQGFYMDIDAVSSAYFLHKRKFMPKSNATLVSANLADE